MFGRENWTQDTKCTKSMLTYSVYILLLLLLPSRRDKTSDTILPFLWNSYSSQVSSIYCWKNIAMVSSHGKNQLVLLHLLGGNFRVYLELSRVTRQENIMPWRLAPTLVRRLTAFSRGALGFSSRIKLGRKGKLHVFPGNIIKYLQITSNYNIWYQSE